MKKTRRKTATHAVTGLAGRYPLLNRIVNSALAAWSPPDQNDHYFHIGTSIIDAHDTDTIRSFDSDMNADDELDIEMYNILVARSYDAHAELGAAVIKVLHRFAGMGLDAVAIGQSIGVLPHLVASTIGLRNEE